MAMGKQFKRQIELAPDSAELERYLRGEEIPVECENGWVQLALNDTLITSNGWYYNDGYYYYGSKENLTKLSPNETANSFISGVTFNENIKATLSMTESGDGKTITYTSTGDGYDNATYTLTIRIDTIQYDQAENVW